MLFCSVCQNMLYIAESKKDENETNTSMLNFTCKNCGYILENNNNQTRLISEKQFTDTSDKNNNENENSCIMKINCEDDIKNFKQYQTPFIKYDYTLPRLRNVKCPNNCKEQDGLPSEVICIKYDTKNIKFLYFCTACEYFWKLDKN